MKNKVTVTIAQREYTLISDEGEAYVEKVASYVSGQIQETMRTSGVSAVDRFYWPCWPPPTSPTTTSRRWRPASGCAAS